MNIGQLAYKALIDRQPTLAAAREQLDAAIASLLEAATAEVSGDAVLRKALVLGQEMERGRVMALLMERIQQQPRHISQEKRNTLQLLLDLLEEVKG